MAKILKRPMFRRGGSTNDGIMSGLTDRKQLANGTLDPEKAKREAKQIQDIMESLAPVRKTRLPLGEVGLALARGIDPLDALDAGYRDFIKRDDARQALLDKRKQAAVSTALGTQLNRRNQSVIKNRKTAIINIKANPDKFKDGLTEENIIKETARLNKLDEAGKDPSLRRLIATRENTYLNTYGGGSRARTHAKFDYIINPEVSKLGKVAKDRIKLKSDAKPNSLDYPLKSPGVYVDVDNAKVIEITSELEIKELPELTKLLRTY